MTFLIGSWLETASPLDTRGSLPVTHRGLSVESVIDRQFNVMVE